MAAAVRQWELLSAVLAGAAQYDFDATRAEPRFYSPSIKLSHSHPLAAPHRGRGSRRRVRWSTPAWRLRRTQKQLCSSSRRMRRRPRKTRREALPKPTAPQRSQQQSSKQQRTQQRRLAEACSCCRGGGGAAPGGGDPFTRSVEGAGARDPSGARRSRRPPTAWAGWPGAHAQHAAGAPDGAPAQPGPGGVRLHSR